MRRADLYDRILGSLAGACLGDALGAPTEQRSIAEIHRLWGGRVELFQTPPPDSPFTAGRRAGQITDDASQLLALADAYITHDGILTPAAVAGALLAWADNPEYYPQLAGPTTRASIERLRQGADPATAGKEGRLTSQGTSNGAAMRVAPAGLAHPGDPAAAIADAVTSCLPSHATNLAIAGAAAVAAAVSVAMTPGATLAAVMDAARRGAVDGERIGRDVGREVAGARVAARLETALHVAATAPDLGAAIVAIHETVGTGLHISEAVPAALGFVLAADGDPWLAVVAAANAGDDTDTVACIAGGIAGAYRGMRAIPPDRYAELLAANGFDLAATAAAFTEVVLRRDGAGAAE